MERSCVDAPIDSSGWAYTLSYPNPDTTYGSKETSGWFQPQPLKSLPATGMFPAEFPDIVGRREAYSTMPGLIFWATESVSKIKRLLFYVTQSRAVCYPKAGNWSTSQSDSGLLESGETFSHHCILVYSMIPRGTKEALTKYLLSAIARLECLLSFFFNVQLYTILEIYTFGPKIT